MQDLRNPGRKASATHASTHSLLGFRSREMGFGFRVVHAFSWRCFTLTVRPCVALALPMTCGTAFFLFRRLRVIWDYPPN